jgi:hypothetical protein
MINPEHIATEALRTGRISVSYEDDQTGERVEVTRKIAANELAAETTWHLMPHLRKRILRNTPQRYLTDAGIPDYT